jgi:hypothetical protein
MTRKVCLTPSEERFLEKTLELKISNAIGKNVMAVVNGGSRLTGHYACVIIFEYNTLKVLYKRYYPDIWALMGSNDEEIEKIVFEVTFG